MSKPIHPIQPLITDSDGSVRFKENAIIRHMLDTGPFDMNSLAVMNFTRADREQFAQLIGYSWSGAQELSYVSDRVLDLSDEQYKNNPSSNPSHPIQPLVEGKGKELFFKSNPIVKTLWESGGFDVRKIKEHDFSDDDLMQVVQLLGCSLNVARSMELFDEETLRVALRQHVEAAKPSQPKV